MIDMDLFEKMYRIREDMRGTFHDVLFDIIDERGLSNKEVYTICNIDRRQFSKIQCNSNVKPSKKYILALCVGVGLSLEETKDLLSRADKAFNPNDERDQFVIGFIKQGCCDVMLVNDFLEKKGLELLGS
ncbi:MAG: hypothetical protein IJ661_01770 [Lachnospiraceae bacterium]|nr:hypothetical protein [Lachnospiraceae bacterium]